MVYTENKVPRVARARESRERVGRACKFIFFKSSILKFGQKVNVFPSDAVTKKYSRFSNTRLMRSTLSIMIWKLTIQIKF